MTVAIEAFSSADDWSEACAGRLASALGEGLSTNNKALFAGAGGSTPSPIYQRLAQADLDWSRVAVTLVDERHVPESSPDSNARLMRETLLTTALEPAVFGVPPGRDGMAPPQERISLNIPYLARARRVVLALTGAKKRAVFEAEAAGDPAVQPIAALIASGAPLEVLWTE